MRPRESGHLVAYEAVGPLLTARMGGRFWSLKLYLPKAPEVLFSS
jgi:hypothetical protein